MTRPKHLKRHPAFPFLNKRNHRVTSDDNPCYNCIAFAMGVTTIKWWPSFKPDYYWPGDIPSVESLDAFIQAFGRLGYRVAHDGSFIEDIEKVAVYTKDGIPTHAAIQVGPDKWQSKLGDWYDIEHSESAVTGGDYGNIAVYLERKNQR